MDRPSGVVSFKKFRTLCKTFSRFEEFKRYPEDYTLFYIFLFNREKIEKYHTGTGIPIPYLGPWRVGSGSKILYPGSKHNQLQVENSQEKRESFMALKFAIGLGKKNYLNIKILQKNLLTWMTLLGT
ncbi:hypothetical protein M9H77_18856 [Catharanthus roseus]|uniref:Uncharacterized protein n=1 Tax=Catharanthus roseus TaxID=4058 RepID=A0ACC0B8Q4_CATRO|nr:hypothetical protein M9H77_18856 [Catharanthus roseus]